MVFALTQFAAPSFAALTGIGQSVGARAAVDVIAAPEVPAGYAFSIWFVIFILALGYAAYQALPAHRDDLLFKRVGLYTAALFFFGTAWMLVEQVFGNGWPLVLIIFLMLFSTLKAFFLLLSHTEPLSPLARRTLAPMLGLTSGWLTVAACLNTISVLRLRLPHIFGQAAVDTGLATLLVAAIASGFFLFKSRGNAWFAAAVLWALAGVIVANIPSAGYGVMSEFSGILILVVIVTTIMARRKAPVKA